MSTSPAEARGRLWGSSCELLYRVGICMSWRVRRQCVSAEPYWPESHAENTGSLREAVDLVVRDVSLLSPDPAIAAAYAQQVKQYRHLRSALTAITSAESSRSQ